MNPFLPVSKKDMKERGWEQLDFVLVSADAYVDHPSFGAAIIARVLESQGFRVGILGPAGLAAAGKLSGIGEAAAGFYGVRREHRFHGGPITQWPNAAAARMSTVPAAKRGIVPTGLPSSIPSS